MDAVDTVDGKEISQSSPGLVVAGGDEVVAEEGGLVVAGLAEVFLLPGFFVGTAVAKGLEEIVVGPFEAVVAGVGLAPLGFEFIEEALLDGVGMVTVWRLNCLGLPLCRISLTSSLKKLPVPRWVEMMSMPPLHMVPGKPTAKSWRLAGLRANSSKTRWPRLPAWASGLELRL